MSWGSGGGGGWDLFSVEARSHMTPRIKHEILLIESSVSSSIFHIKYIQ